MRPQSLNPARLTELFRKQFQMCRVRAGETLVVLSDLGARREYAASAFAAAKELGADIYEMCVSDSPKWTKVGVPTVGSCKGAVDALKAADMLVCLHVPLFTKWLKEVRAGGTRVLLVRDHPDDLEQCMSPPGLKEAVLHAADRYRQARAMRVTSEAGTDLTVRLGEYPVNKQYGIADEPGHFDHWGSGLVHTFPNEGSAQGTVVISPGDAIILPYSYYVSDEIRLEIRDGFIRKVEGGKDAKLMKHWLDSSRTGPDDLDGYAISHLGWGMNPGARWDNMMLFGAEPERGAINLRAFPGCFLFSTGPNSEGGGTRTTRGHYDVPMRDCSIFLDGEQIIDAGRLVDPKMVVAARAAA
jgi:2,5-dihydroxypyridine 5,6-dioxygenase